jgi:cation transport regulator ChaB
MPAKKEELPSTLERSPKKVRRTYEKALDSAHETYNSEERAHRTAWSAVKHVAAKKGGISGRSRMTKGELVEQLRRHSDRETARARKRS